MGLGDVVEGTGEVLGEGVGWVGDKAADGLDAVGWDSGAEGVRDASEWSADKLGAGVAERQLGETEDPKELIHGDVEALTETAEHLKDFFTAFERMGTGLRGLDASSWRGEAGDRFREKFEPQPKFWTQAADACESAAKALVTYASTVQWAQGQAKEAIAAYKQAKQTSEQAVDAHNKTVDAWNRKNEAGQDPGPRPGEFTDPGKAGLERAQHQLSEARSQRNTAAGEAKQAISRLVEQAPAEPGLMDRALGEGKDFATGMALNGAQVLVGASKGLVETVQLVRMVSPMDPYNLTHPGAYLQNMNSVLTGLASTAAHPERIVGSIKNADWRNPGEVVGKLVVDLAGGKGAGGVVKGGLKSGLKSGLKAGAKEGLEQGAKQTARKTVRERLQDLGRDLNCKVLRNEPVDMATGRMVLPQTDVTLPGTMPLEFTRTFESAYRNGGWFGPAWASTIDERLEVDAEGVVHVAADGSVRAYPHPVPGLPTTPVKGMPWELERYVDGSYKLTDPLTSVVRTFEAPAGVSPGGDGIAKLASLSDQQGHWISVEWTLGQPTSIQHSGGYELTFTCETGRITNMYLATEDGPVALRSYAYNDRGHLTAVTNADGATTTYEVDDRGRIVKWTDSNSHSFSYMYDDKDRCLHHEGEAGYLKADFRFGLPCELPGHTVTETTDSLGHVSRFVVDAQYRVVAETDRAGRTTGITYDDQHRPLTVTDPAGNTTTYTYDGAGRPLAVQRPDGTTATATYDESGNLVTVTAPDGAVTRHDYDAAGRPVRTTQADGAEIVRVYDARGHLAAVTDSLGHTTRIESDLAGLPLRVTDPLGATTRYVRDSLGRPLSITDPLGRTTRATWSAEGHLLRREQADEASETWEWDGEGNLLRHTDRAGGITVYTYTHFDLLASRTEPDGSCYEFVHDTELRLRTVTNPQGLAWSYEYDPDGLVTAETDFDGRQIFFAHDEAGRLSFRANTLGQTISYRYDALSRLVTKNMDGDETRYGYDPAGRLISATTVDSELVMQRDRLGRLRSEMYDGRVLAFDRDPLGRPVRRVTPAGAVTTYLYDEAGNRTGVNLDGHTLDSTYDACGREVTRALGAGSVHPAGGAEVTWSNTWDAAGRLASQTVAGGRTAGVLQQRHYSYRPDGHLLAMSDHLNGDRRFDMDRTGRVTTVSGHDWHEGYAYDPAGNQTSAIWPTGFGESAAGVRTYTGNRLRAAGRWSYVHDEAGRVIERRKTRLSRRPDIWRYTWDAEDRLISCVTPDGTTWRYEYDPLGRRVAKQRLDSHGHIAEETVFTWDGTTLVEQTTTRFDGNELAGLAGRAISLSWEYAGLAPLAQAERAVDVNGQEDVDQRFFAIVTDLVGTPSELVTPDGHIAGRTRATLWGATSWEREATAYTPLRFPGQYQDLETGLHYNFHRHYDPATARYMSPDPLGLEAAPNPVAYVHNPHTSVDPLGLKCSSAIEAASDAAFKAAENPSSIFIKNKHLASFEGRYAKFGSDDIPEVQSWVAEALRSDRAVFKPNGLDGTFKMEVDMGRAIGTKGQTGIRMIVADDGRVINAFPFNAR